MGCASVKPQCSSESEVVVEPGKAGRVLANAELSRAQELIRIPGAEVVLIGSGGAEVPVRKGSFALARLEAPRKLAVLSVGNSTERLGGGFCYPLLPETPVCLSGGCVLTVDAGDGDVFGIRLPKAAGGGGKLQALEELLTQVCTLQVQSEAQEEPDLADRAVGCITAGGRQLASGVGLAAERLSRGIHRGGDAARARAGHAKEVKVGQATKARVAGVRRVTGEAVLVAGSVVDGLMDTAAKLGQEAGAKVGPMRGPASKEGAAMKVGVAVGMAGLQVFDSLAKAGDRLLAESCDETAAVVGQRYGKDAGEVARDGLGAVLDAKQVCELLAVEELVAKASLYTAKGLLEGSQGAAPPRGRAGGC